jgi:hypothetical protein
MDTTTMNRSRLVSAACGLIIAAGLVLACNDTPTGERTPTTYTVGGAVSGLAGSGLVLRDNGGDDLAVSANGTFTFATPVSNGAAFDVTVFAQPTSPAQTCVVTDGSGTMANANLTTIAIVCTTTYTVGGTVTGLAGSGLVLRNNGGDDLAVSSNGAFTFATPVSNGAAFDVTVFNQPISPAQTCVVTDGSGTMSGANVTTVGIVCTTNTYTVGGTVSDLAGSSLVLRDNGGDDLAVSANGSFSFATPVASGAAYSVTVLTQPTNPTQTCVVTGGSGTVSSANVINVAIACATSSYTVGGTVSGLTGSGLVLRNNAGDDLAVTANGSFTFATPVAKGATYSVTVVTQPANPAQTCVVAYGSGMMASANITTVAIACTTGTPQLHAVGGTVAGLAGSGLVLRDNGGDDLAVSANGAFTFAAPVANGATYNVTVFTQPANPAQMCVVANGSGMVANANITTVAIACTTNGTLRVTVTTTGPDAPATDTLSVGRESAVVPSNGTVSLAQASGTRQASLYVAQNCTVTSPNYVSVTVAAGGTTDLAFSVTCVANGTARVTVATTGPDAPAGYWVVVQPAGFSLGVPSNGTVSFALASGIHTVSLASVSQNCTVTSPNNVSVTVATGATTDISFSVTCVANGTAHVTVATTGPNAPAAYSVQVGPGSSGSGINVSVPSNGSVSFALALGTHSATLPVPPNCTVSGPNPVSVTVAAGAPAEIAFSVTCVATPTGTLHITVATTGTNGLAAYSVRAVKLPPAPYSYTASTQHGTVSFAVAPGRYLVVLDVPMNCTWEPYSPNVTVVSGGTTSIGFTVACQ